MNDSSNELKSLEYIANYSPLIPVFIPYKYVLIHTKKGIILARETNDKKIVSNLQNNLLYKLKSEDKKEYVSETFVFNALKDLRDKEKDDENRMMQWMQYITSPLLGALVALYMQYTIRITISQIIVFVLTSATIISIAKPLRRRIKKISDENYYTALKEIG